LSLILERHGSWRSFIPGVAVWTCINGVWRLEADGRLEQETLTFGTMTQDILGMADWLAAAGVTHVAMEATGVYWKPIYNLLESRFTLLLVNARHVAIVGCAPPWCRPPGPRPARRTPTSRPNTADWRPGAVRNEPYWRWHTLC
jgi:hypothetical protein